MKNYSAKEWVMMILGFAVAYVLCISVTSLLIIPTNQYNAPLREKMYGLVETVAVGIITAIGVSQSNRKDNGS